MSQAPRTMEGHDEATRQPREPSSLLSASRRMLTRMVGPVVRGGSALGVTLMCPAAARSTGVDLQICMRGWQSR